MAVDLIRGTGRRDIVFRSLAQAESKFLRNRRDWLERGTDMKRKITTVHFQKKEKNQHSHRGKVGSYCLGLGVEQGNAPGRKRTPPEARKVLLLQERGGEGIGRRDPGVNPRGRGSEQPCQRDGIELQAEKPQNQRAQRV